MQTKMLKAAAILSSATALQLENQATTLLAQQVTESAETTATTTTTTTTTTTSTTTGTDSSSSEVTNEVTNTVTTETTENVEEGTSVTNTINAECLATYSFECLQYKIDTIL